MTRECTRAQTTTSYDSRYMECTPGYIRWRSSRRLESRPPRSRRSSRAIDGGPVFGLDVRAPSFVCSFVPSRRSSSTLSVSDVHTLDRENHRPRAQRRHAHTRRAWHGSGGSQQEVVVEREINTLSFREARENKAACRQAMLGELTLWYEFGVFQRAQSDSARTPSIVVGS